MIGGQIAKIRPLALLEDIGGLISKAEVEVKCCQIIPSNQGAFQAHPVYFADAGGLAQTALRIPKSPTSKARTPILL